MVLPYIDMNQPWVYMCSPSWTHLPPHPIPLGHPSTPALSTLCHASNLDWWSISHMIIYMFQCYSLKSSHLAFSHRVQKTVLYIFVSFAVSHRGLKRILGNKKELDQEAEIVYRTETGCSHFVNPDPTPDFTVTSKTFNPSEPSLISWGCKSFQQVVWNDRHMFILSCAGPRSRGPRVRPSLSPGENLASPPASGDCLACASLHSLSLSSFDVVLVCFCLHPSSYKNNIHWISTHPTSMTSS